MPILVTTSKSVKIVQFWRTPKLGITGAVPPLDGSMADRKKQAPPLRVTERGRSALKDVEENPKGALGLCPL